MKNLKYYIRKAQREKFAIGAFNFSTFDQVKGIATVAQNLKAPIILNTSEGESKFAGLQEAVAIRNVLRKRGLAVFLNLDHGKSFEYLKEAIAAGYDMVHFDGSKLPFEENIKISKQVSSYAHWRGVVVEGEIGRIGTDASRLYTEKFEVKEENLTTVEQAKAYMKNAPVDLLAISVGTFHGMEASGQSPHIYLDKLANIHGALKAPLVLHGGSGTPEDDLRQAIQLGIAKININTETRLAFTTALRQALDANKDEVVPYKYFPPAIEAVQQVVTKYIKLFGAENKA